MITSNVLQRTYRIKYHGGTGTGFTVDHDGARYFITARHVVDGLKDGEELSISHDRKWVPCTVRLIGHGEGSVDVCVLALPTRLSPDHPLPILSSAFPLTIGHDVFLVGFPFGLHTHAPDLNANYPIPFVKRGVVSAFGRDGGQEIYYLDAHNNPGFSGGPVVFRPAPNADYCVAGVISGYRFDEEPVYRGGSETDMLVRYNTGIVICWPIRHALEMIAKNPLGFELG